MAKELPQRALKMCEAEIERLQQQQDDLRADLEKVLEQHGISQTSLPSGAADSDFRKLASDLKNALSVANQKRQLAVERLHSFEALAEREESEMRGELRAAQNTQTDLLRAEIRSAELETDIALKQAKIQREMAPHEEDIADAVAIDTLGADTVEKMLRAEAAALQTALKFYREQRHTTVQAKATIKAEEALRRREDAQREEAAVLDAMEERVRIGRAMVADAMKTSRSMPREDSETACREAQQRVRKLETDCEELRQSMVPLQEQHAHLQWLRRAAEQRILELEERFTSLRTTTAKALAIVEEKELDGVPALVEVLSQLCFSPRIAFLVLDSNHNGQISMTEFETGLRQRLCLDYKVITGMHLRPLFKAFDISHSGAICEEDFTVSWHAHSTW